MYRVQFMAEGEEPPVVTHIEFHRLSLEVRVSDTWLAVWKAFNQAHELVRFVLEKIAKQEDFPRSLDAVRFLNVWSSRALQLMEWSGNELRASCVDTCAHDSALRFAGQASGSFTMAGLTDDDQYLRKLQLPDLWAMNDRLNVEKARTLERVRAKSAVDPQSRSWLKSGLPPGGWHMTPLCGLLKEIVQWAGTTDKTLHAKNGKRWWVTEWTGKETPYAIFFPIPQQYGDAVNRRDNPKQSKPAGENRRKSERTGAVVRKRRAT